MGRREKEQFSLIKSNNFLNEKFSRKQDDYMEDISYHVKAKLKNKSKNIEKYSITRNRASLHLTIRKSKRKKRENIGGNLSNK